jgi:hypothetical protein
MSVPFEIPEWLVSADPPPPDTSGVDLHRVEDLVNRFIAAKQDALFDAPDAYYRTTGGRNSRRRRYRDHERSIANAHVAPTSSYRAIHPCHGDSATGKTVVAHKEGGHVQ